MFTYTFQFYKTIILSVIFAINFTSVTVKPQINGDVKKERVKNAGEDVELQCDIVGYPIRFEWQYKDGIKITGTSHCLGSLELQVYANKELTLAVLAWL